MLELTGMATPELRTLHQDDASTVREWLRSYLGTHLAWWAEAYGKRPQSSLEELVQRDWDGLLEASRAPTSIVRIAGANSPVGVVSAHLQAERYMGFTVGVLAWIYVDPAARGQGVADSLMNAAGNWMSEQGAQGRQVYATITNSAATKLYERHGYRSIDYRMLSR
jgi:ribosomal protein S18 acetylase RimI-like enzyme